MSLFPTPQVRRLVKQVWRLVEIGPEISGTQYQDWWSLNKLSPVFHLSIARILPRSFAVVSDEDSENQDVWSEFAATVCNAVAGDHNNRREPAKRCQARAYPTSATMTLLPFL